MNFKLVVIVSFFLFSAFANAATLNMNDDDYNALMKLLAEQELEDEQRDDGGVGNTIDDDYNPTGEDMQALASSLQQQKFVNVDVGGQVNTGLSLGGALQSALSFQKPNLSTLIGAPTEVLGLVQTFLELKAQVFEKFNALLLDNFDVIKNVYRVFATKIRHLHSFTLKGVWVLRKILEFALQMFGSWEINKPQIMVDLGIDKLISAGVGYNH